MNRCLKCNSLFPSTEHFCDIDGTPLVPADSPAVPANIAPVSRSTNSSNVVLAMIAIAGIAVGALLFLAYLAFTRSPQAAQESTATSTSGQQQIPLRAIPPPPTASVEPSVEPSPSPSPEPSPSPQASTTPFELSRNPISTAAGANGRTGPVIIRLHSGVSIEADEAWQTGEGIWYRKSSVLTLLDPREVKSIEKVAPPSPQPTTTASPSP